MDRASLILVLWNRLELTKRMVANFWETTTSDFNLIVIDNNSTDGTKQWLQNLKPENLYCKDIQKFYFDSNRGLATGRNKGLELAKKYNDEWIGSIDNDVEFPKNWLQRCINIMKANQKYSIGINFEDVSYPIITKNKETFQFKAKGNQGGAGTIFPRDLHNKLGFFNTSYEKYGEEDSDWGFRARCAGYNLGYLPEPGLHFGVGELDTGEYRIFKDECRKKNIAKFQKDCHDYINGRKSIYLPYSEKP